MHDTSGDKRPSLAFVVAGDPNLFLDSTYWGLMLSLISSPLGPDPCAACVWMHRGFSVRFLGIVNILLSGKPKQEIRGCDSLTCTGAPYPQALLGLLTTSINFETKKCIEVPLEVESLKFFSPRSRI